MKLKNIKYLLISSLLLWCSIAFAQKTGKQFVITANIAGMKDGVEVRLYNQEHGNRDLATTHVKNHAFRLVGKVVSPTLCKLEIDDVKPAGYQGVLPPKRGISLFVENVNIKVSASDFGSIPLIFPEGKENSLLKELNVKVVGGTAQKQYSEYRHYIHAIDLESSAAFNDYLDYVENSKPSMHLDANGKAEVAYLKDNKKIDSKVLLDKRNRMLALRNKYNAAEDKFIAAHPDYAISLMQMSEKTEETFQYTNADYDKWLSMFKNNYDQVRYAAFVKSIQTARNCLKNAPYTDFEMVSSDSVKTRLSEQVGKSDYIVVDFWASWCGWCRRAIPHIKELYARYNRNQLEVISVSVDDSKSAWYHAMKSEQMPWRQYVVEKEQKKVIDKAYNMLGIPDFLLIDRQGRVVFATSSPDELDVELSKRIK
jgi:thiol-disulfide isomerase/thioredoxin